MLRLLFVAICVFAHHKALSYDAFFGGSLLEEGDERISPAFNLLLSHDSYNVNIFYNKLTSPPSTNQKTMVTASYVLPFSFYNKVYTDVGAAFLEQTTLINYNGTKGKFQREQTDFNLGFLVGFFATYKISPIVLRASWQSALFPAGINGGILLAYGRKQYLTLALGIDL